MCGFVAFVGCEGFRPSSPVISNMLSVISHRGPDDEGTYFSDHVAFGFRRLSILDVTPAGKQPMHSHEGNCTIVFNGEIYNYLELRKELSARGHRFVSDGDTEILLHAYLEWGDECVGRLNGMWAFLIHDRARQRIFGARDRFGMKPLYICEVPEGVLFASEIKSIRASGQYREALDMQVCARFFYESRLDDTQATFYKGIRSIPAACCFEVNTQGRVRTWAYWQLPVNNRVPADPAATFAELFDQSVEIHMRSDVPLGVNLSGGLDSTAILCAIARHRTEQDVSMPIKAFSFQSAEYDESRYIAATLAQTGAQQHILSLGPHELWDSLSRVLWHQDEPVHSITAVVGFHLSALAARHGVKVILNGQGADETLAGYPSYFRDYWYSLLASGSVATALKEINAFVLAHGGSQSRLFAQLIKHCIQTQLGRSARYRKMARRRHLHQFEQNDWFDPQLAHALPETTDFEHAMLDAVLARAVQKDPLPLYLRVEDRNAMAHSVETRLPFLDPRLVKLAFCLPEKWKMRGSWNKFILREAQRDKIPEIVRSRPDKMGFPTPFSRWLRVELYQFVRDIIEDTTFSQAGPFRVESIRRDLERHRNGEIDISGKLFDVIQFHLWQQLDPMTPPKTPASLYG
ncbi:asparagine synthase (glutamine-hydrolyzing) [Nitrosospira multiformis]|uniref:asparagine synthase (glutamine-hydrolyzing) n=1 Tax=Nitrosospira multiformis TaxID=1231 RepID=A0A1I7GD51_9PROT|nr:asparagine synthase (glutamine-hydrolyzing) [Nitrosospira multiformis]SFU46399.1 asparagine synthase (glutamine-hydrolysing) [Nitrosospira multiformis]